MNLEFPLITFELIGDNVITRNVQFTFSKGTKNGSQTETTSFILTIIDNLSNIVYGPTTFSAVPISNSPIIPLPIATGYKATLIAYDVANTPDPNPPSIIFDVIPAPPPPAPPDPILNAPILL